jgi:molybdopterin molybdotransferase
MEAYVKAARSVITRSVLSAKTAFCKEAKEAMQDLSLEQAQKILLDILPDLKTEIVYLNSALNRVLARDISAPRSLPDCEQSAVDGYAVGSSRPAAPSLFRIVGSCQLGELPPHPLQSNDAVKVKTGGGLPPGTCAVVPHEKTRYENQMLLVDEKIKDGQNIKAKGEDFLQDEVVLKAKSRLTAGGIALLAALCINAVEVYRLPRIGIVNLAPNVVPAPRPITM